MKRKSDDVSSSSSSKDTSGKGKGKQPKRQKATAVDMEWPEHFHSVIGFPFMLNAC